MSVFTPQNDRYLYLDMNSFFARAEQQLHPQWQNKPLVVAPYTGPTGCCIAVSPEAKLLGIKTSTTVRDAKRIYPQVIVADSRPPVYRQIHHQLLAILKDFTPWVYVKSIDEMAIPLSPSERGSDNPVHLAYAIKNVLKAKLGDYLTASIGVGPNEYLAKQASEYQKPDGLTVVRLDNLEPFLKSVTLQSLTGVGYRMLIRFHLLGITNPHELYLASPNFLRKKLGLVGEYWYLRLHGYPIEYMSEDKLLTLGHSCVLQPEARNWPTARKVFHKLVIRAGERLRKKCAMAQGVRVTIRFSHHPTWHRYVRTRPFQDSLTFYRYVNRLLQTAPLDHNPFAIAVTAVDLTHQSFEQPDLFQTKQNPYILHRLIDKVNTANGSSVIKPASLLGTENFAPERIPFGKPR